MAGKHISIPALLKIGAGALDNLGIYLKELQLQKVVAVSYTHLTLPTT